MKNNNLFLLAFFLLLSLSLSQQSKTTQDNFKEKLEIEVLPDGKILSRFSFDIEWKINTNDNYSYHHTNLFPKALATISHDTAAEEIHLSFTQGRWRNGKWGKNAFPAPAGVELRAWFLENNSSRVDELWKQLVYSLGGVFCASLQYLDLKASSNPVYSFQIDEFNSSSSSLSPFGEVSKAYHRMRYGALPREAVCTENHTPWIKLLPCRDISGLGNLMNPLRVYDVLYHSMQTHVKQRDDGIILKLSLSTVVDPKFENWFLTSLFGRPKSSISSCPLASESILSYSGVDLAVFQLSPQTYSTVENTKGGNSKAVFDLKAQNAKKFDVEFKWDNTMIASLTPAVPILLASRVLTGYGGERGGFKVHITNTVDYELNITYFETVPWFVRPYYHTLQISINGVSKNILSLPCARIIPPELRDSPSLMELCLTVPAQGKVVLSMEFEKEFLHYSEFPPDAHRGFDLPAAVITTKLPNNVIARFYTENLLLSLPTPDFSMLYNVITLTCTVMALFYGSVFNMSIRRLKNTFTGKDFVSDRPLAKLYRFITSKIFKAKPTPTTTTTTTTVPAPPAKQEDDQ